MGRHLSFQPVLFSSVGSHKDDSCKRFSLIFLQLALDELGDCDVFDTQLQMVHPHIELDHFSIFDKLQLDCVQSSGYLLVIHF